MGALSDDFAALELALARLLGLLEEADHEFWRRYLRRSIKLVEERKLSGATFILGCYGGEDTLSDLIIGKQWQAQDPQRFTNLNVRLGQLRNELFAAANQITSRASW